MPMVIFMPWLIYPQQPLKIEQGLIPYRSQSIMQPEQCNTACLQTVHMTDVCRRFTRQMYADGSHDIRLQTFIW